MRTSCPRCGIPVLMSPCRHCGVEVDAAVHWPADLVAPRRAGDPPGAAADLPADPPRPIGMPRLQLTGARRSFLLGGVVALLVAVLGSLLGAVARTTESAPSAPRPTALASATTPGSVVTWVPPGSWLLVLASLEKSKTTRDEAVAKTRELAKPPRTLVVVDSDAVAGLRPGFWAVAEVGFPSEGKATAQCPTYGRKPGGTCYARKVSG